MRHPTGLTPNPKIKTALTPVGVDAGVMCLLIIVLLPVLLRLTALKLRVKLSLLFQEPI